MEAAHEAETKTLNENKEDEIKTLTEKYEGEKKVEKVFNLQNSI